MNNLDALWRYQEADLKVDKYESEIRQFPMRRKLVSLKKYYSDQQNAMRAVESSTDKASKGIIGVRAQYDLIKEKIDRSTSDLDDNRFETAMEVREAINNLNELISRLTALDRRLATLVKDVGKLSSDLRTARANATKAKKEYADLKVEYDAEFEKQSARLTELTEERDKLVGGIPAEVLARYQTIKKRCTPPVAVLNGDQCGGCNMSLPALIVSRARRDDGLVECETCGRIIFVRE